MQLLVLMVQLVCGVVLGDLFSEKDQDGEITQMTGIETDGSC